MKKTTKEKRSHRCAVILDSLTEEVSSIEKRAKVKKSLEDSIDEHRATTIARYWAFMESLILLCESVNAPVLEDVMSDLEVSDEEILTEQINKWIKERAPDVVEEAMRRWDIDEKVGEREALMAELGLSPEARETLSYVDPDLLCEEEDDN